MTIHGELTELGYQPAANCYDCHGSHSILACDNPASRVSAENRLTTCQKCHPYANANFAKFDPHVNYHDPKDNPIVYWVYRVLLTLLLTTFGFFGLHAVFWSIRGTGGSASAKGGRRAWWPARRPTCGSCPCTGRRTPSCWCRSWVWP